MKKIILASNNLKKIKEIKEILINKNIKDENNERIRKY